jgi:L-ascorbate metabolism protein UlaG (beta-lactamase superfamily)
VIIFSTITIFIVATYMTIFNYSISDYSSSPQFKDGKFVNIANIETGIKWYRIPVMIWRHLISEKPKNTMPSTPIPVIKIDNQILEHAKNNTIFRLGHSTILLKLNDKYYLTDPVFSERASPVQWAGPKRFHNPPINIDELPHIEFVILSHNHYDHLDKNSIIALKNKVNYFIAPLGVGDILINWGVDKSKIIQLDWWQSKKMPDIEFIATPSQHFSSRGFFDKNKTLWSSWVIKTDDANIFFSGDTGYSDSFKEIGKKYGPFDVTLMETGAYNKNWPYVHMQPEQSVQAHIDVQGKLMLPIHNSTFNLSTHAWNEPLSRANLLAKSNNINILVPKIGEPIYFKNILSSNQNLDINSNKKEGIATDNNLEWWNN